MVHVDLMLPKGLVRPRQGEGERESFVQERKKREKERKKEKRRRRKKKGEGRKKKEEIRKPSTIFKPDFAISWRF